MFVRFRAVACTARGTHPGVFALVDGLAARGLLNAAEESFRRSSYAWYDANLIEPSTVDPAVYDRVSHPRAEAWFHASARAHIAEAARHQRLVAAHGVGCVEVWCSAPGVVLYRDRHQVVVEPWT